MIVPRAGVAVSCAIAAVLATASLCRPPACIPVDLAAAGTPRGEGDPLQFARLMPSGAVVYLSIPHLPSFMERAKGTGLARALSEKRVTALVQAVTMRLPPELATGIAGARSVGSSLLPALGGAVAVGVVADTMRAGVLHVVAVADVSRDPDAARAFGGALGMLGLAMGETSEERRGGSTVTVLRSGAREIAAWAITNDIAVVGTSSVAVGRVVGRFGGGAASLKRSSGFARVADNVIDSAPCDYFAYVDLKQLTEVIGLPSDVVGAAREVALGGCAMAGVIGDTVKERMFVECDSTALAALENEWDLLRGAADALPGRSLAVVAASGDVRRLVEVLAAALGSQPASPVRTTSARILASLRLVVSGPLATVARHATGTVACAVWSAGRITWYPMAGLVAPTESGEAARQEVHDAVSELARATRGRTRAYRPRGTAGPTVVEYVERGYLFLPLAPAPALAAVASGIIAGGDPRSVASLARAGERLAASRRFTGVRKALPDRCAVALYIDLPRVVDRAFEPYARLVLSRMMPGTRLSRGDLPAGAVVGRHLSGVGLSIQPVKSGMRIYSITPAGSVATIAFCAALSAALLGT